MLQEIRETILEKFLASAVGRKLAADQRAEDLTERRKLVNTLTELNAQAEHEGLKAAAKIEAAQADATKAEEDFKATQAVLAAAIGERFSLSQSLGAKRRRIETELKNSAPGQIDEFCDSLRAECSKLRMEGTRSYVQVTDQLNLQTMRRIEVTFSNKSGIIRRLDACREALKMAESLKIEAVEDVPGRLEEIWNSLPAVGEPVKVD